jgi:hypothetical protein
MLELRLEALLPESRLLLLPLLSPQCPMLEHADNSNPEKMTRTYLMAYLLYKTTVETETSHRCFLFHFNIDKCLGKG